MNRAPSPRDRWWNVHKQNCGGTFTKIKEPEKPAKQSKKDKKLEDAGHKLGSSSSDVNKNNKNAITNWFQKTDPSSKASTSSNNAGGSRSTSISIDCDESDLKPPVNPWTDDSYKGSSKNNKPASNTNSNPKTGNNTANHGKQNKGKFSTGSTAVKGGASRTSTVTSKGKNPPTNENDIYRSSSTGASSNIYGFKMSANNKQDTAKERVASFSGSGQRIGSTGDESSGNSGRENFLKRLENNIKGNTQRKPPTNSSQISISSPSNTFRKPKDSDFSMTSYKNKAPKKDTSASNSQNQSVPSFTSNQNKPSHSNKQLNDTSAISTNTKRILSSTSSQNSSNSPKKRKLSTETQMVISSDEEDNIQQPNEQTSNLVDCPACPMRVPEHLLNEHLDECLS